MLPSMTNALHLAWTPEGNELLAASPLALVIGMVLDQQIPLEKAFSGPLVLQERLGRELDAADIAGMDEDALVAVFSETPALHRFPGSMAKRVQAMCRLVVAEYDGDVSTVWSGAEDGKDLVKRVGALPGFGKQKAQIFGALLCKQYGVDVPGWREATGEFGVQGSYKSVADIVDGASLDKVRAYKQELKAAAKAKG